MFLGPSWLIVVLWLRVSGVVMSLSYLSVGVEKSLSLLTKGIGCYPGFHVHDTVLIVVYIRSKCLRYTFVHRIVS